MSFEMQGFFPSSLKYIVPFGLQCASIIHSTVRLTDFLIVTTCGHLGEDSDLFKDFGIYCVKSVKGVVYLYSPTVVTAFLLFIIIIIVVDNYLLVYLFSRSVIKTKTYQCNNKKQLILLQKLFLRFPLF